MGKSLVGVGDQQLGSEDSSVTIFIWCVKDCFENNLVSFHDSRVFFFVIYLFRVAIGYNTSKGKMVVNKERGYCPDHTKEE
jgi:hypothetical protein